MKKREHEQRWAGDTTAKRRPNARPECIAAKVTAKDLLARGIPPDKRVMQRQCNNRFTYGAPPMRGREKLLAVVFYAALSIILTLAAAGLRWLGLDVDWAFGLPAAGFVAWAFAYYWLHQQVPSSTTKSVQITLRVAVGLAGLAVAVLTVARYL